MNKCEMQGGGKIRYFGDTIFECPAKQENKDSTKEVGTDALERMYKEIYVTKSHYNQLYTSKALQRQHL